MNYKIDRWHVGDKENRESYAEAINWCECCGGHYALAVHHHIPKQFQHHGERYTIDLHENFSTLCRACHGIIERNRRQYNREIFGIKTNKAYEYWHEIKGV